jgi:hypothetical protein
LNNGVAIASLRFDYRPVRTNGSFPLSGFVALSVLDADNPVGVDEREFRKWRTESRDSRRKSHLKSIWLRFCVKVAV